MWKTSLECKKVFISWLIRRHMQNWTWLQKLQDWLWLKVQRWRKSVPKCYQKSQQQANKLAQNFNENWLKNLTFWKRKFTTDDILVFQYDPETKHCSFQWNRWVYPRKCENSMSKQYSFAFLQQIYYKPVLPQQSYILAFSFQSPWQNICQKMPELQSGKWTLHHDNALSHTTFVKVIYGQKITNSGTSTAFIWFSPITLQCSHE